MPQDRKSSHQGRTTKSKKNHKMNRDEGSDAGSGGNLYDSEYDNTNLPIRIRQWDGVGKPPNLCEHRTYDSSREYVYWIPAKEISADVLAHRMRSCSGFVDDGFRCRKFRCARDDPDEWPPLCADHHFDIDDRSTLILYVLEGKRGFIINNSLSREQLDSLIKQSYRYAKWNGFANVQDLSRLEFGAAKWIHGSIPPGYLRDQGAKPLNPHNDESYAGGASCEYCGCWIPYLGGCKSCGSWVRDPDATTIDPMIEAAVQGHRFDGQDAAELGIGALIAMGAVIAIAGAVGGGVRR